MATSAQAGDPPIGPAGLPLPTEAPQDLAVAADKFPVRLAANYSVANFGASIFYGLFNFAMPLYLSSYLLPAWLAQRRA